MTEAREIRHSYGCVKETDMVLLKRMPKVKIRIESILGREARKFCIAEVKVWSRDEEDEGRVRKEDRGPYDWQYEKPKAKPQEKKEKWRKVYIDAITGTMYDFHTRECLSSSKIRMID
jgi:hypothetical protein